MALITHITSEKTETNCYLIEKNGHAVIIDPIRGETVIDLVNGRNLEPDLIFLTHEHFDHIEGLEVVRNYYQVPVVACEICSDRIQDVSTNLSGIADLVSYFKTGKLPEEKTERYTCEAADITYAETYELQWQDIMFTFQRLPGHSPGSVIIIMKSASNNNKYTSYEAVNKNESLVIFTGDYLIKGEEEVLRLKGGSEEEFTRFAEPVLSEISDGTHIYPGHGADYFIKRNG